MKEIELVDAFCEFLNREGYEFKRELRKGSYHCEGYVDVVIKSQIFENMLVGVEAKINGFQSVLYQCRCMGLRFPYMYILYPKLPSTKSLKKLVKYRESPGLIIPRDDSLKEFYIHKKPRTLFCFFKQVLRTDTKIWRNWNENRCGRKIHDRELPEGYDREKAKALEDDYEWYFINQEKKAKLKLERQKEREEKRRIKLELKEQEERRIEARTKKITDFFQEAK